MEASELRIGNYLYSDYGISQSVKIEQGRIGVFSIDKKINAIVMTDSCNAIPLTEEWLIKFDLLFDTKSEEIVTYSMIPFNDFTVVLQNNEDGRVEFNHYHICYINHVHQLQNLYFALTGEELTIKEHGS